MRIALSPRGGWLLVIALLVTCLHSSVWKASAQSCCNAKTASALAVSITFSVCQGNVVLAAETLAQASASGCGDAYAAGVGVGVANLAPTGPGGLNSVVTNAFSSALSASISSGSAVAVAQGLAVALASATPSVVPQSDLLLDVAGALANIAAAKGCLAPVPSAVSFYKSLLLVAPSLAPVFAGDVSTQLQRCPLLSQLAGKAANFSSALDQQLARLISDMPQGKGFGLVQRPLFSPDIAAKAQASSLAVTIANVSCPTAGNAQVAAVAIASAALTNGQAVSAAIAGVIPSGANITSVIEQTAMLAAPQRNGMFRALAGAVVASDANSQALLIQYIAAALNAVAGGLGCVQVDQLLSQLRPSSADPSAPPVISASQLQQLQQMIKACPNL